MKIIFYGLEHAIPAMKEFTEGLDEEKLNIVEKVLDKYSKKIITIYENITKGVSEPVL